MSQDTLSLLQADLNERRTATEVALRVLGQPVPGTEQEWLLFNVNERLRSTGHQKPLENLNPGQDGADTIMNFLDAITAARKAGAQ